MIIVEFSLAQKAFHKQTFAEMIANNLITVMQRKQTDYIPVAFFETDEQANEWIDEHNELLKNYTMYKSLTTGNVMVK